MAPNEQGHHIQKFLGKVMELEKNESNVLNHCMPGPDSIISCSSKNKHIQTSICVHPFPSQKKHTRFGSAWQCTVMLNCFRSQNFPSNLVKSIHRAAAPFRPDLHGYSCATARQLMQEAFTGDLPQLLGFMINVCKTKKWRCDII